MNEDKYVWLAERQQWFQSKPEYARLYVTSRLEVEIHWTENATEAAQFGDRKTCEAFILANAEKCVLAHAVSHGFMS